MYSPLSHIDENRTWTEADLSREKSATLVASVVYISILMVVGVVGNILVLVIFYFRFGASTHRCFILTLAIYDLCACSIGAPWAITESFFAFNYHDVVTCKIFRFVLYYTCIASSLTLVLIAIERSRKICTPLKTQFTVPMAKKAIYVVVFGISTLSASPALVMYGNYTLPTGYKDINGTKCFITDDFSKTFWPKGFNIYLLGLAFLSTAIMAVCYIRIARTVSKMGQDRIAKKMRASERSNVKPEDSVAQSEDDLEDSFSTFQQDPTTCVSERSSGQCQGHRKASQLNSAMSQGSMQSQGNGQSMKNKIRERSSKWANKVMKRLSSKSGKKTLRVTKMLTFVTVAFVISYLPHLSLMLWSMFTPEGEENTLPTDNAYQVLFYSFLINNLVNPFIYAAMDLKFKNELKKIFTCSFNIKSTIKL